MHHNRIDFAINLFRSIIYIYPQENLKPHIVICCSPGLSYNCSSSEEDKSWDAPFFSILETFYPQLLYFKFSRGYWVLWILASWNKTLLFKNNLSLAWTITKNYSSLGTRSESTILNPTLSKEKLAFFFDSGCSKYRHE